MKILSGQQLRAADAFTIKKQQISSEELMERAGTAVFNWLHQQLQGSSVTLHLFCGIGNNGGDGLVVARHLVENGYNAEVYVVNYSDKRSAEFLINLDRLKDRKVWPHFLNSDSPLPQIGANDLVVDAIFGTGLNRKPVAWVSKLITHINNAKALVIAIDVPSGMFLDKATDHTNGIIRAQFVLTFQAPKLVFFLPGSGIYCEEWTVLDIGLDPDFIANLQTDFELIGKDEIRTLYRPRKRFTHKGSYGHALIVGGSKGKIGAVQLAVKACLRVGSGLVTAFIPKCGYSSLQTKVPEAMVLTDKEESEITAIAFDFKPTVIGIGIGMGTSTKSIKAFTEFLKKTKLPMVIDADGINILSKKPDLLKLLPPDSVLTPHPKELERLIGSWENDFEMLEKARSFSVDHNCVMVLKGAYTITVFKEKGFVNSTGNAGMATAGSGDVLLGIITGLIAQGYSSMDAACLGVYLHASAGDKGLGQESMESLLAGDIIKNIGKAYKALTMREEIKRVEDDS